MSGPVAPTSGEFKVNTYNTDSQTFSSVAALSNGGFVVTWSSYFQDGSGYGIYGQRYNADGTPAGTEFRISSFGAFDQKFSSVAALSNGGFVVTWSSSTQDDSGDGIYGQRYNADGTPAGTEFHISTHTPSDQKYSSVAAFADGGFVVTWQSLNQDGAGWGIYAQRYNADGTPAEFEFKVNTQTAGNQQYSAVAVQEGGGFVVTWLSSGQDGDGYGIYAQRYNADGTLAGTEFKVNTQTSGDQLYNSVAALDGGGFVITWSSNVQDGSGYGIYAQRYNADGTPAGTEFRVNSFTTGDQQYSSVAAIDGGGFLVTWQSSDQDGSGWGVYGQLYGSDGAKIGGEFRLSETTTGSQSSESFYGNEQIVQLAGGDVVATWHGDPSISGSEAYARRFEVDTTVAAPAVALATDTGVAGDGQTNDATVNVTLAADVASWEYQVNGGGWTTGSATSFELPSADGTYSVEVRQTDDAGNVSSVTSATFELDTTVDAPAVALATDTGVSGDGQTSDATVNVTLATDAAGWEYQVNGGGWTAGSGSSFELPSADGTYSVEVRQTDDAGNVSAVTSATFELNTTVDAPSVALATDTGVDGDGQTNDATVNVTLATDVASWEYQVIGGGWTAGSGSSFELPSADGTYTVEVRQTDDAGNLSAVTSATFELDTTVDAPAVALAADTGVSDDGQTSDATVNVTLAADAAGWEYQVNGAGWTAGSGTSFELPSADGTYSVEVRQTDDAGNVSAVTSATFELDATVAAPAVALATDTGVADDGQTSDATVNVTLAADSVGWEYRIDGHTWTTGSGTSFELPSTEATYTVEVRQTDDAGNVSAVTSATFELDKTVDAPAVALATDTGVDGDGQTNDATVNVTLAADAVGWEYQVNGGGWTAGAGSSFELSSTDGTYSVEVRQTDDAGNVSAVTSATFELDTTVEAPAIALATDTGVAGDGQTSDATVNVTLAADAVGWEYRIDGHTWATGSGTSFALPSTNGTYSVEVRQTDDAGNVSAVTSATFELDMTVDAPAVALATDTGLDGDGQTNDATVNVTLAADAAGWEYQVNGGGWTAGAGSSSFELPSADGTYSVEVRQTDDAGNVSAVTSATFELDTSVDAPAVALATDTGLDGDGQTNDATVNVTLAADAVGWEYQVNGGGWTTGSGTSFELPSADGTYSVEVRQTDDAGNLSAVTSATFELDTTVDAPAVTLATDTGVDGDGQTSDATVNVTLATDAASWEYQIDGGGWVAGSGSSFELPSADGTYAVEVRQTDDAGNVSTVTSATFELDTTVDAPTVALATDTGVDGDSQTSDATVNVTLATDAASWEYNIDGGGWVAGSGSSFELPSADGTYAVEVRQTDDAGNVSAVTSATFELDTTVDAPAVTLATDTGVDGDGQTSDATVNVTLAADAAGWEYQVNGGGWTAGSGSSFELPSADGTYSVEVRQTDDAGNVSAATSATFELDTTVAASITLNAITAEDIYFANLAGTATVTGSVGGDVQDGDIVTLKVNGTDYTGAVLGGVFAIAVTGVDLLADADLTVDASVTTTDAAGNSATGTASGVYGIIGTGDDDVLGSTASIRVVKGLGGKDTLNGLAGNDLLVGDAGDDTLNGGNGNDMLLGGDGADKLNGGAGIDTTAGGDGNDTHYVNHADDVVVELVGQGSDTVATSVSYTLAAGVEVEQINTTSYGGTSAINLTGNEFGQTLIGNAGDNILDGKGGDDTMRGSLGNDTYYVNHAGDVVIELAGQGTDTVATSISYTLAAGVEVEQIKTTSYGGLSAINLTGNEFGQTLIGNAGDNILNGKGGADTMRGSLGNDTYYVNDAGDVIIEAAGQGTDTAATSISYTLAAGVEVEQLNTTSYGGTSAINLTGNEFGQTLIGNAGDNILDGKSGADTMRGSLGNDTYYVNHAGDVVIEVAGQGTDTAATSINYTLAAGVEIEQIKTTSSGGLSAINLTGNEFGQTLTGNAGNNILNGKGGADMMRGGAGSDTFVFDTELTGGNVDGIVDFNVAADTIALDHVLFGLPTGGLDAGAFHVGAAAGDAADRIVYDNATGDLYFDGNGDAPGSLVQFAHLSAGLSLTHDNFVII